MTDMSIKTEQTAEETKGVTVTIFRGEYNALQRELSTLREQTEKLRFNFQDVIDTAFEFEIAPHLERIVREFLALPPAPLSPGE